MGDFDPDFVTNHLGLTPTDVAVRREGRPGSHKIAKDIWTLSRIYPDYLGTDKRIEGFLDELIGISEKLDGLRKFREVEGVLSCVLWLDVEGPSPGIYLSEMAIAHLKELKVSFNVSLYFV
nr:DUF4279 domain-containing protein [Deinococcus aerius]